MVEALPAMAGLESPGRSATSPAQSPTPRPRGRLRDKANSIAADLDSQLRSVASAARKALPITASSQEQAPTPPQPHMRAQMQGADLDHTNSSLRTLSADRIKVLSRDSSPTQPQRYIAAAASAPMSMQAQRPPLSAVSSLPRPMSPKAEGPRLPAPPVFTSSPCAAVQGPRLPASPPSPRRAVQGPQPASPIPAVLCSSSPLLKELQPCFSMGRCAVGSDQDRSLGGSQSGSRPQTPKVSWRLTAEQEAKQSNDLGLLEAKLDALREELQSERTARAALTSRVEDGLQIQLSKLESRVPEDGHQAQLSLMEAKIQEVSSTPTFTAAPEWEALQAELGGVRTRLSEVEAAADAERQRTVELSERLERAEASLQAECQSTTELSQRLETAEASAQAERQSTTELGQRLAMAEAAAAEASRSATAVAEEALQELRQRMEIVEATGPNLESLRERLENECAELRRSLAAAASESARAVEQLRQELRGDIDSILREAASHQDAGREHIYSVKSELETTCQVLKDQAASAQAELESARREIAATSDDGRRHQDQMAALIGSYAEVKKELADLDAKCSSRIESLDATQGSLKTVIFRDVEEVKPWLPEVAMLKQDLQQKLQELQSELSKGLVACQSQLGTTRLDLHDKLQFVEDRVGQAEYKATGASEAIARLEPAMKQLQESLKEVAQMRDVSIEQASKMQHATAGELMNLETKVQREMTSAREHCSRQVQQVELSALKLREQVADAVERVKVVADGIQADFVQERQRRSDEASTVATSAEAFGRKQLEELREHFVQELMACEGRMLNQEDSVRQFATEQAGKLWVSVQDLQEATKKLEKRTMELTEKAVPAEVPEPKANGPELSVEEVQQFKTQRVSSKQCAGPFASMPSIPSTDLADESARKSQRLHREELLQRLSDAESRLQQQQSLVQRQKEDISQQMRKWSS